MQNEERLKRLRWCDDFMFCIIQSVVTLMAIVFICGLIAMFCIGVATVAGHFPPLGKPDGIYARVLGPFFIVLPLCGLAVVVFAMVKTKIENDLREEELRQERIRREIHINSNSILINQ